MTWPWIDTSSAETACRRRDTRGFTAPERPGDPHALVAPALQLVVVRSAGLGRAPRPASSATRSDIVCSWQDFLHAGSGSSAMIWPDRLRGLSED